MKPSLLIMGISVCVLLAGEARSQSKATPNPIELLQKGRVEEAKKILLEALKADPENDRINAILGQIAFSQKEYARAVTHFGKAHPVLAKNPMLTINYAEALLETKSVDLAMRILEKLPQRDPTAQFETGLLLARFDEFAAAEKHFKLASGYSQPLVLAYNLGLAQYRLKKFADCAATLEQAREKSAVDGDILNLLAQAYMDAGQAQKAINVLQEAIKRDPRDERNYVAAGRLAIDEDLAAVGLEMLDQGLKVLPKSYSILMQRAYIRLSLAQYADSESDYRSAIALEPNSASGRIGLAFVLLQSQHLAEAASLLQDVVRTHPSNYFAHYLLGEMRIHEGLDDEAITSLEKAIALQPAFSAAHTDLGKLYLKKNDRGAALRELETAVKLDPEDTTAYYQLSIAYRRAGQKEKAQQALALVRRLNEEQRNLGTTRFLTQKYRKARSEALAP